MTDTPDIDRLARVLYRELHGSAVQPELAAETIEHYGKFVRAILHEARKPSEGLRLAGLMALAQEMEKRREDWERPEMQKKIREEYAESDYPIVPTSVLMLLNEGQSTRIWDAMISHLLGEDGAA